MRRQGKVQKMIVHARKFGTEGVMEAARDEWLIDQLTHVEVVSLQKAIDKIESEPLKVGRITIPPRRHRLTAEERVKRLLGLIEQEGEG